MLPCISVKLYTAVIALLIENEKCRQRGSYICLVIARTSLSNVNEKKQKKKKRKKTLEPDS